MERTQAQMYAPKRQQEILRLAREGGRVDVLSFAEEFQVTTATFRRGRRLAAASLIAAAALSLTACQSGTDKASDTPSAGSSQAASDGDAKTGGSASGGSSAGGSPSGGSSAGGSGAQGGRSGGPNGVSGTWVGMLKWARTPPALTSRRVRPQSAYASECRSPPRLSQRPPEQPAGGR